MFGVVDYFSLYVIALSVYRKFTLRIPAGIRIYGADYLWSRGTKAAPRTATFKAYPADVQEWAGIRYVGGTTGSLFWSAISVIWLQQVI